MAIVQETIRVVVSGANPQTLFFTVPVDTATGAGTVPLAIPYVGTNSGSDAITAFMDSHSLTSNIADVNWQGTSGAIAVGAGVTIDAYSNNAKTRGWPGGLFGGSSDFGRTFPYLNAAPNANSLVFNQVIPNYPINGFNNQPTNIGPGGGYKLSPTVVVQQTNTGTFASKLAITGTSDGNGGNADNGSDHPGFVLDVYGTLVVKTAGTYTVYMNYADKSGAALWISGGVTVSSFSAFGGNGGNAFPAASPHKGYSPLCVAATNMSAPLHPNVVSSYVTFPTPGIYPFEIIYNQWAMTQFSGDDNSYFQITYLAGAQNQNVGQGVGNAGFQFFPVTLISAPPTGAPPSGALRLTPTGGAAGLKTQGQTVNLTLTVQNVPYTSIPYMPILEGTAGFMTITNSGANFNFQTYNGAAVDTTAAASGVFDITANNSAINGLFTVTQTGATPAPFRLTYGGGAFTFAVPGSQISSSDLTVTADDIAWFNSITKSFDTFTPVSGSGGISFSIDVDYMTKPTVKSTSPASLNANAFAQQALQINLDKPMSPQQQGLFGTGNTVVATASLSGGATLTPLIAILDGAGFLQGWSTKATVPTSSTNGSIQLSMSVTGTLTYLSGGAFVTNTVTYITGVVATIPTIGNQFVAPVAVSLATTPSGTNLSSTSPTVITATVYTFDNNPLTCTFNYKFVTAGNTVTISPVGALSNSYTGIVGGKTAYYKVFTVSHTFTTINGNVTSDGNVNLGFIAQDTVSGLSVTYLSTTVNHINVNIVGGGGGGGCFTGNVGVYTPEGFMEFALLPHDEPFLIENETGVHLAELVVHEDYDAIMIDLGDGKLVTCDHFMKDQNGWIHSGDKYPTQPRVSFHGTVYNMHVLSDRHEDMHYILFNGDVAHNLKNVTCFTEGVDIWTPEGLVTFGELPHNEFFEIVNHTGKHTAELIVNENYAGWMLVLGENKLVTISHKMEIAPGRWVRAEEMYPDLPRVYFEGTVYNLHILSDQDADHHYLLFNGDAAHNASLT